MDFSRMLFFFFSHRLRLHMCNPLGYEKPLSYLHTPAWLLPLILPFLRCLAVLSFATFGLYPTEF